MLIRYSASFYQPLDLVGQTDTVPPTFVTWPLDQQKTYLLGRIKARNLRSMSMNVMTYEEIEEA